MNNTVICQKSKAAFTLIELLVVVTIIGLLVAMVLPALASSRRMASLVVCKSNLSQLGRGLQFYANDWNDFMMPPGYDGTNGTAASLFWWGQRVDANGNPASSGVVDHTKGFLWPYLKAGENPKDVFACPVLLDGTYENPITTPEAITSAYGYNGYYLCPKWTPVWSAWIGTKPWQRTTTVEAPSQVFSFADAAVGLSMEKPHLTAYLDPPQLYMNRRWMENASPTTHFRHQRRTNVLCVDGHSDSYSLDQGTLGSSPESQKHLIGSVGQSPSPHYILDKEKW
jgi:prepilin-type N-terminal cleavage/methylation domain-containing protein/prepilin-type processing-associated H-X9-DG protein